MSGRPFKRTKGRTDQDVIWGRPISISGTLKHVTYVPTKVVSSKLFPYPRFACEVGEIRVWQLEGLGVAARDPQARVVPALVTQFLYNMRRLSVTVTRVYSVLIIVSILKYILVKRGYNSHCFYYCLCLLVSIYRFYRIWHARVRETKA